MTAGTPLVFGEVLFDCFPDGSEIPGGAPFNVAWHLQGFGQDPLFVSRVGSDARGKRIRQAMREWGMSLAGLQQDDAHPTGEVAITLSGAEPTFDIVAQRAYDYIDGDELPAVEPSLVYHGTLAMRHRISAAALSVIKDRHDAPVFVDINLRPPWWTPETVGQALHAARWLKLNDQELQAIAADHSSADIREQANGLLEQYGLELLIVTRGEAGALAIDAAGGYYQVQPQNAGNVVDTVGAGDAFSSVVILSLILHWPIPVMLQRAQQFASAVIAVRGAILNEKSVYEGLIQQWTKEKP